MRLDLYGVLAALAILVPASGLRAQDTTVRRVAAPALVWSLRSTGVAGPHLAVLTQALGPQPKASMDAVADSLADVAIGLAGNNAESTRARSGAVSSLYLAGIGEPGLPMVPRAVPYAGTAERLRRVSETSHHPSIRGVALRRLSELDRSKEFLRYLRGVATTSGPVAAAAVAILVDDRGPEGLAIAKNLYRSGAVKDPEALFVLQGSAGHHRW